jgi:hypothetical protein
MINHLILGQDLTREWVIYFLNISINGFEFRIRRELIHSLCQLLFSRITINNDH